MSKKDTKVICFANNKGGSGKTTTCANAGYGLSLLGNKVLMIDGDMQMNLSLSFLEEEDVLTYAQNGTNIYQAVKNQDNLLDYIVHTPYENVDIVPSSTLMSSIEYELFTKWQREFIFKKCLQKVRESGEYDYILVDAPPTLGGWVMNLMCASDYLVIPVEASPWGLFGLANMFDFLQDVKEMAEQLSVLGIAVTKVDTRKNYFKQTLEALKEMEDIPVFDTYIRVDSAIEWAQDNNKPVAAYKGSSRSAQEFMALSREIQEKC